MKKLFLFLAVIIPATFVFAQTVQYQNEQCFNTGTADQVVASCNSFDGGYYVVVTSGQPRVSEIKKYSLQGELQWSWLWSDIGGTGNIIRQILEGPDGIFVSGSRLVQNQNDWPEESVIQKLSLNGETILWQQIVGGDYSVTRTANISLNGNQLLVTVNGSQATGLFSGNNGGHEGLLLILDQSDGFVSASRLVGGTGSDVITGFWKNSDNGYIVTGSTTSVDYDFVDSQPGKKHFVVHFDNAFNIVSIHYVDLGDGTIYHSIQVKRQTMQCVTVGSRNSNAYIAVTTANDGLVWEREIPSQMGFHHFKYVVESDDGGYLVGGYAFNPANMSENMTASLVKFSYSGDILWSETFGEGIGYKQTEISAIIERNPFSYLVGGLTNTNMNVCNCPGPTFDGFLFEITESPEIVTSVSDTHQQNFVSVFPNPTTGTITVRAEENDCFILMTDVSGKNVFSTKMNGNECTFNPNLSKGVYFLTVGAETTKVILQ